MINYILLTENESSWFVLNLNCSINLNKRKWPLTWHSIYYGNSNLMRIINFLLILRWNITQSCFQLAFISFERNPFINIKWEVLMNVWTWLCFCLSPHQVDEWRTSSYGSSSSFLELQGLWQSERCWLSWCYEVTTPARQWHNRVSKAHSHCHRATVKPDTTNTTAFDRRVHDKLRC